MTHYAKSVTLDELGKKIQLYIETHPEDKDKMIYFDALHINGDIYNAGPNYLELI